MSHRGRQRGRNVESVHKAKKKCSTGEIFAVRERVQQEKHTGIAAESLGAHQVEPFSTKVGGVVFYGDLVRQILRFFLRLLENAEVNLSILKPYSYPGM